MTHISENKLLQFALEILSDETKIKFIANHLAECSDCKIKLEEISKDIKTIGSVKPEVENIALPKLPMKNNIYYPAMKAAAIFLFGIVTGYFISNLSSNEPTYISSSYITLAPPADSFVGFTESDATKISEYYYRQITNDQN